MMHNGLVRRTRSAAATLVMIAWGCGSGAPSVDTSTTEATVKGIVTIRGKPISQGTISFDPSNVRRKFEPVRTSPIGKDGSYTVKTLLGGNHVTFAGPAIAKEPRLQDLLVPYDVRSGENTFNVELPPAANP
jgi:hypothetical protein